MELSRQRWHPRSAERAGQAAENGERRMCERPTLQPRLRENRIRLGHRNFARVVGNILHGNPDPEHIPCHRVVNSTGQLSRLYAFGGIEAQRRLLVSEGVVFKNEQVVDLSISQMVW